MLRNQASALIEHERIETTVARAKELRPFVERIITVAKRSLKAGASANDGVTARRTVARDIDDREVVQKLFGTIAPRYADRAGGYTRLLRLGYRRGDSAEVAQVELIGSEYDPNQSDKVAPTGGETPKPKKTVGGRIREALAGGRKKDEPGGKMKADKTAKGGKRSTTPRKAGGS
jgi:large subunit ribosomal protein L17